MSVTPEDGIAPWSELEGREILQRIREAMAKKDLETALRLVAVDLRARFRTGDKLPDWYKPE